MSQSVIQSCLKQDPLLDSQLNNPFTHVYTGLSLGFQDLGGLREIFRSNWKGLDVPGEEP